MLDTPLQQQQLLRSEDHAGQPLLSVVTAAYNETQNLRVLYRRLSCRHSGPACPTLGMDHR
jgi:hypothetical protein